MADSGPPYRDDYESMYRSLAREYGELKMELETLTDKKVRKPFFTPLGLFLVISIIFVLFVGSFGTGLLIIANKYSMSAAIGGGSLTFAGLLIIGVVIIGGLWEDLTR